MPARKPILSLRWLFLFLAVAFSIGSGVGGPEESAQQPVVEIVEHGGYPELRVDGAPFFLHSAAFLYDRVPRDLWAASLDHYRELGINTIDLYIPWNWHEPSEGEFDFDGHTNPRRDLRALLQMIREKKFKLVARPGPQILNEWRHGGYPGWLLERPEYKMDRIDFLEGRYAPLAGLNAGNAEAAAQGWLDNATHMTYARKWLEAVAHELVGGASGTLLFVQLEDDMALGRTNITGPAFWRYMEALRAMLEAGGLRVPVFINPTDPRVAAAGSALPHPIGVMGVWYMSPRSENEAGARGLSAEDASTLEFFVEELKTQPAFPPVLIEYQAGWYCPGEDDRPLESPPSNTLLSSRLLLANGLHGINYFPLQDSYTPAGYSVPWANRSYRWDAALSPDGDPQTRADAVARNGQLLEAWGQQLAASHKRADFGLVYPVGAYPQGLLTASDIQHISLAIERLERLGQLALLSSELLDPEYQPVEQLLRHPLILLPVFDPAQPKFQLSESAQRRLVEYVRRGGTLAVFPARPSGKILEELWAAAPSATEAANSAIAVRRPFGTGQVLESTKDFFSWIRLDADLSQNRARQEQGWSAKALHELLDAAGVRPAVQRTGTDEASSLMVTELVSNEGTGFLGERQSGRGFLSVTNLSNEEAMEESLDVLSPAESARSKSTPASPVESKISLHVSLPPHESLFLPLEQPLCSGPKVEAGCHDSILAAGAELLRAEREGRSLELTFYAPARAEIYLRLAHKPSHITLEDNTAEAKWDPEKGILDVVVPRGASPDFRRVLKVDLPYRPGVPEKPPQQKARPEDYEVHISGAVRLPMGEGESLASIPPLVPLEMGKTGRLFVEARNISANDPRIVDARLEGPVRGSTNLWLRPGGTALDAIKLKTQAGQETDGQDLPAGPDGLVHATLAVRSNGVSRMLPIVFLAVREGVVSRYQFDFDRDGAKEWVFESTGLRLIVSPESGGSALAFVDKYSGFSLMSSAGALRDAFSFNGSRSGQSSERTRGRYGLFNRAYAAEWLDESGHPALRMRYDAPDVLPAGASIEKTVQFEGSDGFQVSYRVQLHGDAKRDVAGAGASGQALQSFVAVNSVLAFSRDNRRTRFCWPEPSPSAPAPASAPSRVATPAFHCEDFKPGGAPIDLPEGVSRLEIRAPDRPGLALEWEAGKMTIEQENFSAWLRLQFPRLTPGGDPGTYFVRFRILRTEEPAPE
jgi:hypothetical protein